MRERERRLLPEKVEWRDSIGEIGEVTGCIFSNELVDNFSVHRVVMRGRADGSICGIMTGDFVEELRPAPEVLQEYLIGMGVNLPPGFWAEINLEATRWIQELGNALQRGWVMTIDYGYPAATLYSKRSGTLACYHRHQVHSCPTNLSESRILRAM